MTEEQAIEILKEIQETNRAWLIRTTEATCEKIYLRDIEAIETVLNILKDKDKIIKEMAKYIAKEDKTNKFCDYKTVCDNDCEECVEAYFKESE